MISLILGLGNIGKKYEGTRHNVGFEVIDHLAGRLNLTSMPREKEYDWAVARLGERELILAKPRTYMNLSGLAAAKLLEKHDLTPEQMLVIVDDFALPLGAVRIRGKGSDGGHNGLESLIEELGTQAFPRIRLGIGQPLQFATKDGLLSSQTMLPSSHSRPPLPHSREGGNPAPRTPGEQKPPKPVDKEVDIVDYVLGKFRPEERPAVDQMVAHAADAVLFTIDHRLEETMSKYNFNPAPPESP